MDCQLVTHWKKSVFRISSLSYLANCVFLLPGISPSSCFCASSLYCYLVTIVFFLRSQRRHTCWGCPPLKTILKWNSSSDQGLVPWPGGQARQFMYDPNPLQHRWPQEWPLLEFSVFEMFFLAQWCPLVALGVAFIWAPNSGPEPSAM